MVLVKVDDDDDGGDDNDLRIRCTFIHFNDLSKTLGLSENEETKFE